MRTNQSTMMAASLLIAAAAIGSAAPASADADKFVAISYSAESHVWGTGYNFTDLDGARIRSLSECQSRGGNHCEFIAWAKNGCAALAVNGDRYYGWYGGTPAEAQQQALAKNGGGHIEVSQCSS